MTPVFELCEDYVTRGAALDPVAAGMSGITAPFGAGTDYGPDGVTARADLIAGTLAALGPMTIASESDRLAARFLRERRCAAALLGRHRRWRPGRRVADPDRSRHHYPSVHAAEPQLTAEPGVDEAHRLAPEALDELRAPQVRRLADPQHGLADREHAARREVIHAQVQVNVELITAQRHPLGPACDQFSDPRVHHRDLPVGVGRPVRCTAAAADEPVVTVEPGGRVQYRRSRHVALADRGAADDQDHPAAVARGLPDLAEPGLQALA
jgi:hypothetical protein